MDADYSSYIEAYKKRARESELQRQTLIRKAHETAEKAALILKKEFCVNRVVLFGSLARGDFQSGSDIDLAVWGLAPYDYLKALIRVEEGSAFEINLVPYEKAYPHIRTAIDTGMVLLERD